MITIRTANDTLIDYTTTLEFVCGDIIAEGCSVILDERQYPVLLAFLERIAALGEGVNFRLEMCVDHRPGYSVAWDNSGTPEQDDEVDRLMEELVEALGFLDHLSKTEADMISRSEVDAEKHYNLDDIPDQKP